MSNNDTEEVESILYRVCDFETNSSILEQKTKIEEIINIILNFMNRDPRFENYNYKKHIDIKRVIYVPSFGILMRIIALNTKIQKIPFISVLLNFTPKESIRNKNIISFFPIEEKSKMVSLGLSREKTKSHFIFKKENSFQFKYAIEISNTFVLKKDLQNT